MFERFVAPFIGCLNLMFIYLKITNQIDWSWWWILSPLGIPALFIATMTFLLIMVGIINTLRKGGKDETSS